MFIFDFYLDTDKSKLLCYFNFNEIGKFYVVSLENNFFRISKFIEEN